MCLALSAEFVQDVKLVIVRINIKDCRLICLSGFVRPLTYNVLQACAVRIMKLPLSARRKRLLNVLMFISKAK